MKSPQGSRSGFQQKAGFIPFLKFAALPSRRYDEAGVFRRRQTMKNRIALVFLSGVISGFLFLTSGCASTGSLAAQQANYPADRIDARGLFTENCVTCHGQNGRAHTFHGWLVGARNLTDPKWQANTTDDEIINAIKTGPRVMPAFGKKLSASEIEALAAYVRTFKPTN